MKSQRNSIVAVLALVVLIPAVIFAQENPPPKFALVIGNGAYKDLSPLANPVNDAEDMAEALEFLGFTVEKILNGDLHQMESAVERLQEQLSAAGDAYGFFFYAGHGVQAGGENYLIPVDANIPNENYLRTRSVSVQTVLDDLNDAKNSLNVVVLDACRDNPFGWSRSQTRGLAIVTRQPARSLIVYATSAGMRASDGDGRNGLFTSQLLPNLLTPGLDVKEVFNRTGADVAEISGNQQIPAIYSQYFGTAYLAGVPDGVGSERVRPVPLPLPGQETRMEQDLKTTQLWSVGVSVGSGLAEPWLVGTVRGTLAPLKKTFIELGFDYGLLSGNKDVGYYYLYPYAHFAYYMPLNWGGIYAGAGGGYLLSKYTFPEGESTVNSFAVDVCAGVNILSFIDVSYTFRTNFDNVGHKVSVGYIYRFK